MLRRPPFSTPTLATALLSLFLLGTNALEAAPKHENLNLAELEDRQEEITSKLSNLARFSLNSGVAPLGYRTHTLHSPDQTEWVQIKLSQEALVDCIIIVAPISRDEDGNFNADAFPKSLRITGTNATNTHPSLLTEFPDTSVLFPRIAPIIIPIDPPQKLNSIKIEATHLSRRAINNDYVFQLAEVLVFSKDKNLALRQEVTNSSKIGNSLGWHPSYLVDGILPYLMNAAHGHSSLPYVSKPNIQPTPILNIDLGKNTSINSLRLHPVDQGDTLPQTHPGDFGLPTHFTLESSADPTFTQYKTLLDIRLHSLQEIGPILQWDFPTTNARYLRLTALSPYLQSNGTRKQPRIGFAEIELLPNDKNILLGKKINVNFEATTQNRSIKSLTDGRNFYGNILPTRRWLHELALRHDLEVKLHQIERTLNDKYHSQREKLKLLFGLLIAFIVGFIIYHLYQRLQRVRQESLIRERIASNLHDELGANLHAIGHLGELAEESLHDPEELRATVQRIHTLTRQTGNAARACSNMLQNQDLCDDLPNEVKQQADRLLADLHYNLETSGDPLLNTLSRRTRIDLLLFLKECLINIIRHSHADNIQIKLHAKKTALHIVTILEVIDDGIGLEGKTPPSLERRAKLLKATLQSLPPEDQGTHLRLQLSRLNFLKKSKPSIPLNS